MRDAQLGIRTWSYRDRVRFMHGYWTIDRMESFLHNKRSRQLSELKIQQAKYKM